MDIQEIIGKAGNPKERTIILVSAVLGILAFFLLVKKGASTSSGYDSGYTGDTAVDLTGTPTNLGTYYGTTLSSSDLQTLLQQSVDNIIKNTNTSSKDTTINLAYSADNSSEFERDYTSGGGSKGGFGLSMFGGFLGVNGGTRPTTMDNLKITGTNTFSTTNTLQNVDNNTLTSVENFLTKVGGTAAERMQHQSDLLAQSEQSVVGIKKSTAVNPVTTKVV